MRDLRELDAYRTRGQAVIELYGWEGDETCGAFIMPSPIDQQSMVIIASTEGGWDHVSVSRRNRTPNWTEMEYVAQRFFHDHEAAVQFHVPASDHVNMHPNCLHWWRPTAAQLPRPPSIFVGIGGQPARNQAEALARKKAARYG